MEHLAEFLDVLEPPLQIAKPNKYKIIQLDIPIVKYTDPRSGEVLEEAVFCADILDIITQDFFARKSQSSLMDEQTQHVEEVKVWTGARNHYRGRFLAQLFLQNRDVQDANEPA